MSNRTSGKELVPCPRISIDTGPVDFLIAHLDITSFLLDKLVRLWYNIIYGQERMRGD